MYKRITCRQLVNKLNIFAQEVCVPVRKNLYEKHHRYVGNEDNKAITQHSVFNVPCSLSVKCLLPSKTRKQRGRNRVYSERVEWTMKNTERMK